MSLSGKICLVTGACRGIGRGIALSLGSAGATVYITGRTTNNLEECSKEIEARGGVPKPVHVDHNNDKEVLNLFERIKEEQNNKLDVLVNNAYAGVNFIGQNMGNKFWKTDPVQTWDLINGVGLRNHYICTVLASRIMVNSKQGLIVNVSSIGGLRYLFNVAYGIGKSGVDRMAADCAVELKSSGVAVVSLWPGAVKTEHVENNILSREPATAAERRTKAMFENGESVEFAGRSVVELAKDPKVMDRTGKVLLTLDLAKLYGFTDVDGGLPQDWRQLKGLLSMSGYGRMAAMVPGNIKIPLVAFHLGSNQF